jgi:hypothetical protein
VTNSAVISRVESPRHLDRQRLQFLDPAARISHSSEIHGRRSRPPPSSAAPRSSHCNGRCPALRTHANTPAPELPWLRPLGPPSRCRTARRPIRTSDRFVRHGLPSRPSGAPASARMPVSCRGAPSSDEQAPNLVVGDCPSRLCPPRKGAHHAEASRRKLLIKWRRLWQSGRQIFCSLRLRNVLRSGP